MSWEVFRLEVGEVIVAIALAFLIVLCVVTYQLGRRDGHPDVYIGMGFLLVTCFVGVVIYLWP